jgi:hypothetical protein
MVSDERRDVMERSVAEIRQEWMKMRYRNLFICPEHDDELVVGRHDPNDRWNDLNIILCRNEGMMTDAFEILSHAPDDVWTLLHRLGTLEAHIKDRHTAFADSPGCQTCNVLMNDACQQHSQRTV